MPIEFKCTQCGSTLRTPDNTAGKQAKCPQCSAVVDIPAASALPPAPEPPPPVSPFGPPPVSRSPFEPSGQPNPYQSPPDPSYAPIYAGTPISPLVPQRFELGDVLSRGFEMFKAQMGMSIAAVVIVMVVNYAFSLIQNIIITVLQLFQPHIAVVIGLQVVFFVTGWIFQTWLGVGQTLFFVRTARGNTPSLGDLFRGGPYLLRVLGASLVLALMFLGLLAVCLIPAGIVWAIQDQEAALIAAMVCGLIAAIPITIIGLIFSQYYYLIVDRQMGAMESLAVSREITAGNRLMLFALSLLIGLINLAGLLACCVGIVFSMPLSIFVTVVAYLTMTGQPIWSPPPPYQPTASPTYQPPPPPLPT